MELILSTNDFKLNGIRYSGFPILLDQELNIINDALNFFIKALIQNGRVSSKKTWATYGQALYDYFSFIEANKFNWKNFITGSHQTLLSIYRDWSISELNLSPNTVNQRLRVIIKFYSYLHENKLIDSLPFDFHEIRCSNNRGTFQHISMNCKTKLVPDVLLKNSKAHIKVLNRDQIKQFLNSINNHTQKLIARFSLSTGLRKEELITFPSAYIKLNQENNVHLSFVRIHLNPKDMKLKGDKPRSIDVPRKIFDDIQDYIKFERYRVSKIQDTESKELFLNKDGLPYSNGGKALNLLWNKLNLPFKVTPHTLRHTYATHTLYDLRKRNCYFDPLLYVRDRLGHSSIHTTARYLHYITDVEDKIMTDYQIEIDKLSLDNE